MTDEQFVILTNQNNAIILMLARIVDNTYVTQLTNELIAKFEKRVESIT